MITRRELRSQFIRESFSTPSSDAPIFANRGRSPLYSEAEIRRSRETVQEALSRAREELKRD